VANDPTAVVDRVRLGDHVGQLDDASMLLVDNALRRVLIVITARR
jgi:mRNA-degrading endonuclease toxin of MazEF toxin-antitoxin module